MKSILLLIVLFVAIFAQAEENEVNEQPAHEHIGLVSGLNNYNRYNRYSTYGNYRGLHRPYVNSYSSRYSSVLPFRRYHEHLPINLLNSRGSVLSNSRTVISSSRTSRIGTLSPINSIHRCVGLRCNLSNARRRFHE